MELSKPQVYRRATNEYNELIETVRAQMLADGMLAAYPVEHHTKIASDYIQIVYVNHQVLPTQENNALLDGFKTNLMSGYFTMLAVSNYQVEVDDYINAMFHDFKELMESDSLSAIILHGNRILSGLVEDSLLTDVLTMDMINFLVKFGKERWPELVDEINNLSPEEIQRRLDVHN